MSFRPHNSNGYIEHDPVISNDFLRQGLRLLVQLFVELEISSQIDALPHERSQSRRSYRNGYRRRSLATSLGDITLEIPKLRKGTYYPAFLQELTDVEPALLDVLRSAYRTGPDSTQLERLASRLNLTVCDHTLVADTTEHLYDLVDRYRQKRRLDRAVNLISYRPVAAIATQHVDAQLEDETTLPRFYLDAWQSESWLAGSLDVLVRIRHALSDGTDAVAA